MLMKRKLSSAIYTPSKIRAFVGIIFFVTFLIFPNTQLSAQTSGLAIEKATGRPLEGVSVVVKNEKTGTATNNAGR